MGKLFHESKAFKNLVQPGNEVVENEFENCSFENCDFSDGKMISCKFIDCKFTNCNLSMVNLNLCVVNNVVFNECKLLGINFSNCVGLSFAVKFESCLLDYCSFANKKLAKTIFSDSSLKSTDFTESDLSKSKFLNCDLTNTLFYRSILTEVDFTSASNYNIDPEANIIKRAKFSLDGVSGLLNKYNIEIV